MNRRLLVVDDEKEILDVIRKYFSEDMYKVEICEDVSQAINKIKYSFYSVVVTDLCFPGKYSGIDLLKAAKERSPKTEVIMITGYGTIRSAVESIKLGAYDYITKPFNLDELELKIRRVFELKEDEEEIDQKHEAMIEIEDSAGKNIGHLEWLVNLKNKKLKEIEKYIGVLSHNIPVTDPNHEIVKKIDEELKRSERYER